MPEEITDERIQEILESMPFKGIICCPDCKHQLHGAMCHNLSSDNDCDCKFGENPTHYVMINPGNAIFVKEEQFFRLQGGTTKEWGKAWIPLKADSIGHARRIAAEIYHVKLSHIHEGEE